MLLALVRKELRAMARDAHGLAAMFLMPAVFIVVMSLALKDVYSPPAAKLSHVVVVQDGGAQAALLASQWQQAHGPALAVPADWEAQLRAGRLQYAIVIEPGFSQEMLALSLPTQAQVRLLGEPGIDGNLFSTLRAELLSMAGELKARTALLDAGAPPPPPGASIGALVRAERVAGASGAVRPSAVQQNVPAWLVFGMFFIVASLSGLFIQERQSGTLARLRSVGVPPAMLLASKALPYLGVNALQALVMLAIGVWLMPLVGGDALSLAGVHWVALVAVLAALGAACVGLALALACAVRTPAQASTVGPALNVVMAAVGGIMVPTFIMPAFMQRLAALSPMNWGLEALLSVLLRGAGPAAVLPQVLWLSAFGLAALLLAVFLFPRRSP